MDADCHEKERQRAIERCSKEEEDKVLFADSC